MKTFTVIQHTSADYLGLMEDHFEGRQIRFNYCRPFTEGVSIPFFNEVKDGLILLGGGPWGADGVKNPPSLEREIELTRQCLMANKIVIGIELGAQILTIAAEGTVRETPLIFKNGIGRRTDANALNGYLPPEFPYSYYMRGNPIPPDYAKILATDENHNPLIFQMGTTAFGFVFHPGFKRAIAEDLIMEFEEAPENPAPELKKLGANSRDIYETLNSIMTGLVQVSGMMA